MSNSYVYDFRMNVSASRKGVMTKEINSSTSQPQLNPLRRVTRAQTRACNESEQVGPLFIFFFFPPLPVYTLSKITVKRPPC
jgi:hypothetical protein